MPGQTNATDQMRTLSLVKGRQHFCFRSQVGDEASGPGSRGADVFGNDRPRSTERAEVWRTPGANATTEEKPTDATAPQRKRRGRTAQLPFGEEKQFEEADIPF